MPTKRVLIADYGNHDSLVHIPYVFKKAGCEVHVYARKNSWLALSGYCDKRIIASEEREAYFRGLRAVVENGAYDWVVPGDDGVLRMCRDISEDDPLFTKIVPLSKSECRDILGSKAGLSLACTEYGIVTPAYRVVGRGADSGLLAESVGFPLLAKVNESAGGSGVFLCKRAADVKRVIAELPYGDTENVLLQKYITGKNVAVEALYKRGALVAYAYSVVTKTLRGEFGVSVERQYLERPEIEGRLGEIGQAFGLHGFASMTFIYDGIEHYFVEADLRPQAWCLLGSLAGTDFSLGIREFFSEHPQLVRPKLLNSKREVMLRHFPREIYWYLEHDSYKGFWLWFINREGRWNAIAWRDTRLLWYTVLRAAQYWRKRFMRGLRGFVRG